MIRSFKHKGLKRFFLHGDTSKVNQNHVARLRRILAIIHAAERIEQIDLPGLNLHPLKGDLKGYWAVKVSGNWRLVFSFEEGSAYNVNYVDYH